MNASCCRHRRTEAVLKRVSPVKVSVTRDDNLEVLWCIIEFSHHPRVNGWYCCGGNRSKRWNVEEQSESEHQVPRHDRLGVYRCTVRDGVSPTQVTKGPMGGLK